MSPAEVIVKWVREVLPGLLWLLAVFCFVTGLFASVNRDAMRSDQFEPVLSQSLIAWRCAVLATLLNILNRMIERKN